MAINMTRWSALWLTCAETFVLYSQPIPSQNLGFIDSKAKFIQVDIGDSEYTIHQSPTVLSSNRAGGTTGAGMFAAGLLSGVALT